MKDIRIIDKATQFVVATIRLHLGGMNYTPTEEDYIEAAWKHAVWRKSVDPNRNDHYGFVLNDVSVK